MAKGKAYYFYQPFRGTPKQGERLTLPNDTQSPEFWDTLRKLAGSVPGYTGTTPRKSYKWLKFLTEIKRDLAEVCKTILQ